MGKESLAHIHVHELSAPEVEPLVVPTRPQAANDNEMPLAMNDNEVLEQEKIAEVKDRLGISESMNTEEPITAEEVPLLQPESVEVAPQTAEGELGQSDQEESPAPQLATETGTSGVRDGGNEGNGHGNSDSTARMGSEKKKSGLFNLLLAPIWALGVLVSLSLSTIIKLTNKALEGAKVTSKSSGGAKASGAAKSSGGGHGGGHH